MYKTKAAAGLLVLSMTVACSTTPTSPSRDVPASVSSTALTSDTQTQANSGQLSGTANVVPLFTDALNFAYGTYNGVTGRFVTLTGDIDGTNFEPGTCFPGTDTTSLPVPSRCVVFGSGPGQFTRSHEGGTAFTTCDGCTIGGLTGDVMLRISYPLATPPQFPGGFTKFTFVNGTGGLESLRGHGTLDFADLTGSFTYHFVQ